MQSYVNVLPTMLLKASRNQLAQENWFGDKSKKSKRIRLNNNVSQWDWINMLYDNLGVREHWDVQL